MQFMPQAFASARLVAKQQVIRILPDTPSSYGNRPQALVGFNFPRWESRGRILTCIAARGSERKEAPTEASFLLLPSLGVFDTDCSPVLLMSGT